MAASRNGSMLKVTHTWWQKGIIYQIYPRSFQDSDGDGIGDLRGIISRLEYLQWLGVSAIWVSPFYSSPMADFGYDIADYTSVDTIFGNINDLDSLIKTAHEVNIKIILDLVPNHTSDRHEWFTNARSSKKNVQRNWYIWKDAKPDGSPPNNWLSMFGGSAWEWDGATQQFYYHAFLKDQPDLNWRNPEVQNAMWGIMRFWLDRGVDGFRVDVMWHMIKDKMFRDNPVNQSYDSRMSSYEQLLPVYSTDQPEVHDIVQKMRDILDEYPERLMIGEIYLPINKLMAYYGTDNKGAHLPFNFQLITLPWKAYIIAAAIDQYEGALPRDCWPNWVMGNHDQSRITSRIGAQQSRIAAILLLTVRGTPTIYYGEEIGMRDVAIPPGEMKDPQGLNMPGKNLSRDPVRTPMQWDQQPNAGFTTGKPWLRLDKSYNRENVQMQRTDPFSMLWLYKRLIDLRQNEPALCLGVYKPVYADDQLIAYTREANGTHFLIVLNLTHRPAYFNPEGFRFSGTIEISSFPELDGIIVMDNINMDGDVGLIIRLNND